jgi:hypothetical protein
MKTTQRPPSRPGLDAVALAVALASLWTACGPTTVAEEAGTEERPMPSLGLPGAEPHPAELRERLRAAVAEKGAGYEPRTHHFAPAGGPLYTNRLILEDSPYLLQHAHNPVNWYPWGPEAFEEAAREDKPIFLSIGYSTCHWCHVMERESFESVEIARILNERFVAIKIDREQRPDVDEIYMTAVQLMTGSGGWPLSSFLMPDGKPFFGGTYFPPQQFAQLLDRVDETWNTDRDRLLATAERLSRAVNEVTAARGKAEEVGRAAFEKAVDEILARHDADRGGFSGAPKFPHEPELLYLLDRAHRTGHREALAAVETSLDAMARGGIYDQVGGGFHRYSTDDAWLVPHFEKMLYNQAHLARAYLGAFRLTGRPFFARVARQTLDYVLREMTSPDGAFYSATDADSEGEEGLFFLWTPAELEAALPAADAGLAADLFGVTLEGNFEGENVLHLPVGFEDYARAKGMELPDLLNRVDRIRERLRQEREKRVPPLRDDKVVTAWNGMMATAFACGHEVLGDERYLEAARRAADFLWRHARRAEGELWRIHLDGGSSVPAIQEDYAYLAEALLALYDQTGEAAWLERAREVADGMLEQFWDAADGGFFMSAENGESLLIARPKSPNDGAIPSGNSVAVRALARLAARSGEPLYADRVRETLAGFSGFLGQRPSAYSYMLLGAGDLDGGELGRRQYAGGGKVRLEARAEPDGTGYRVRVGARIADGWHVNSHEPLQQELVPTVLSVDEEKGWVLSEVSYPEPRRVKLGFQDEPLLVYEGEVVVTSRLTPPAAGDDGGIAVAPVTLQVQACNDEVCLRPEKVALEIPVGGVS